MKSNKDAFADSMVKSYLRLLKYNKLYSAPTNAETPSYWKLPITVDCLQHVMSEDQKQRTFDHLLLMQVKDHGPLTAEQIEKSREIFNQVFRPAIDKTAPITRQDKLISIYQKALRLLPRRFVDDYGEEIILVALESCKDAYVTNGLRGVVREIGLVSIDLSISLSIEWAIEGYRQLEAVSADTSKKANDLASAIENYASIISILGVSLFLIGFIFFLMESFAIGSILILTSISVLGVSLALFSRLISRQKKQARELLKETIALSIKDYKQKYQ